MAKTDNYEMRKISAKQLDDFVFKKHPEANFLQSSAWGKSYELDGEEVFYFGLYNDKTLEATALVILKKAKRGRYLEIPGGPIGDWQGKAIEAFLNYLRDFAKERECVFVRMRPNIADTEENQQRAKELGLVASPMHLHAEHTVMLDLTKSEEDLMADMRRQTRYEVRRSAKLGIKVTHSNSKEAFDQFFELQQETAKRQGFIPPSSAFLHAQRKAFGDNAQIYTASLDNEVLARGLIMLQAPEAVYNEAASTEAGRKLPGAYALQWQVIQDAKKAGLKRYNLFGIAPPNSPNHRYAGVTTFKTGFGGEQIAYLPAQDLVIKGIHYKFVHALEQARKKHRHL